MSGSQLSNNKYTMSKARLGYLISNYFKICLIVISIICMIQYSVKPVNAQYNPPSEVDFNGKSWTLYDNAVVKGHNNEYLINMTRE